MLAPKTVSLHLLPPLAPSAASLPTVVSEHGFAQMLHALFLPPPLWFHIPQRPAAGGHEERCRLAPRGAVREEAALGERLRGRLIRQQEVSAGRGGVTLCRQALGCIDFHLVCLLDFFLLLMLSLTNLEVPVDYTINVAMIYTF